MKLDETFLPEGAVAPEPEHDRIQVGAFQPRSLVAGPGTRAVVWVAGCLRRCPGCMKPDLFAFDAGTSLSVDQVKNKILDIEDVDGVTFSGGEPFEQAIPLARLGAKLKAHGLSVLVYSGYRLDMLRAQQRFHCLLEVADIVIDGEYRQELSPPIRWRGSSNQSIHALSGISCAETPADAREIQASITAKGLRLTGFPSIEIERQLAARLAFRGIMMKPADFGDADL